MELVEQNRRLRRMLIRRQAERLPHVHDGDRTPQRASRGARDESRRLPTVLRPGQPEMADRNQTLAGAVMGAITVREGVELLDVAQRRPKIAALGASDGPTRTGRRAALWSLGS